jgi:DNA modification methylase
MTHTLHLGDCRTVLATLDDASIDAIVCDPPYELNFMGRTWDNTGIAYDVTVWQQCLRVLKPGGHLIAFGGSRTYHRLAVAIEDAGFEIRDQIQWIYGSGFPKSLDVSKAMDKQRDDRAQTLEVTAWIRQARDNAGLSNANIDNAFGLNGMAGHWTSQMSQPLVPTLDQITVLIDLFGMTLDDVPDNMRTLIWTLNGNKGKPGKAWGEREVVGKGEAGLGKNRPAHEGGFKSEYNITAPATDLAKQWQGWGTALKPAHEPAVLARKPLCGTVADNVRTWGVGALNIDGTRVEAFDGYEKAWDTPVRTNISNGSATFGTGKSSISGTHLVDISANKPTAGRWPANVIFDEEAALLLGEPSRFFYTAKASKSEREAGLDGMCTVKYDIDKSIIGGLSWNDVSTVAVQLLQKVTSDLAALKWHIGESGENITALYPSDSLFTTSMETNKITALKTCNSLMHLLTNDCTADVNCVKTDGTSHAENAESLKAWMLSITNGKTELALGAVNVVLTTLLQVNETEPLQRNNIHSTVKPLSLMRYLVRLVTPKGGKVLDPFMGSGSTGCAAVLEGFDFVGIDITPEYVAIAQKRIAHYAVESPLEGMLQ